MLKKSLQSVFIIIFSMLALHSYSQVTEIESSEKDDKSSNFKSWKDRLVLGGSFGAAFGNETYIDVSPIAGYRVTKSLTMGLGFTYQYEKYNFNNIFIYGPDYHGSITGGRMFAEYDLFYGLFAHTEYEYVWYNFQYEDATLGMFKGQVPAFYLGGGYNFMIDENSKFQFIVLYDVLNTYESVHPLWVFRAGFLTGL